jgi:hypothetical protein
MQTRSIDQQSKYSDDHIAMHATFWEAGIDLGSDTGIIVTTPVLVVSGESYRGKTQTNIIPNITGDCDLADILNARGHGAGTNAASVLKDGEYIIRTKQHKKDRVVGAWAEMDAQMVITTKGVAQRYWELPALEMAFTLLSSIIPTEEATVRCNLGLPYSLFKPDNRQKVKANLEGTHEFTFNGTFRRFNILVGTTVTEGYAPFAYFDVIEGLRYGLDIGGRTMNLVAVNGQTILPNKCRCEEFGVGPVHSSMIAEFKKKYRYNMSLSEARRYLIEYTAGKQLTPLKVPGGRELQDSDMRPIIADSVQVGWMPIENSLGQSLNQEDAAVGSHVKQLFLYGGGSYVFESKCRLYLPDTDILLVDGAQFLNAQYYHDMVEQLNKRPGFWYR